MRSYYRIFSHIYDIIFNKFELLRYLGCAKPVPQSTKVGLQPLREYYLKIQSIIHRKNEEKILTGEVKKLRKDSLIKISRINSCRSLMLYDLESYYIVQVISARVRNSWMRHANLMEASLHATLVCYFARGKLLKGWNSRPTLIMRQRWA